MLRSGSECTRPAYARAMREVVARESSIWRNEASGIKKSSLTGRSIFSLRTIDMSANSGKIRQGTALSPPALPEITAADSGESLPAS